MVLAQMRAAHPRASRVRAELVAERPFEDDDLFTAKVAVGQESAAWCPANQRSADALMLMQWQYSEAIYLAWRKLRTFRIQDHAGRVRQRELAKLDEDHAAAIGSRRVTRAGRVANVRTRWIVTVFVAEHPVEYEKFFAKGMLVGIE